MYYGDGRTKTQATRDWSYHIFHQLNSDDIQEKLEKLREVFNSDEHVYHIELSHYVPESRLFTKAGKLSRNCYDLTNIEKSIVDLLFLPKYFDKINPYGVKNLKMDDVYLMRLVSEKRPSIDKDWHIGIEISIHDAPKKSVVDHT